MGTQAEDEEVQAHMNDYEALLTIREYIRMADSGMIEEVLDRMDLSDEAWSDALAALDRMVVRSAPAAAG